MIIFLLIYVIIGWFAIKNKKLYLQGTFLFMFLIMLLRHSVCFMDSGTYVRGFTDLDSMTYESIRNYYIKDTNFWIITKYLHSIIYGNYTLWFGLIAAMYLYPLYLFIKKYSDDYQVSIITFIFLSFFLFSMTGLRQTMAMSCTTMALLFLLKRKLFLSIVLIILGSLFHNSALIFLIAIPLIIIPINKKILCGYAIALIILLIIGNSLLPYFVNYLAVTDERYDSYLEAMKGSTYTYLIQQIIIIIFCYIGLRHKINIDNNIRFMFQLALVGLLFYSLSPVIAEMFRVGMYFSIVDVVLLAIACRALSKRYKGSRGITVFLMMLYIVWLSGLLDLSYYYYWEEPIVKIE